MDNNFIPIDNISYLKKIRSIFINSKYLSEITFIIGNNTCDLDSAICSYLLTIALNIKEKVIILDNIKSPKLNLKCQHIYLPVLNIKRGTLPYRIDVKYVFDKFNLDENDFWYISDDYLTKEKLFQYSSYINSDNINNIKSNIILVDHNLLIDKQKYLSNYIINIYDHHIITYNNYPNLKSINIQLPIGSCSTIILSKYFMDDFPSKLISPLFALTANIIDTRNFAKDYYGNRWVDLDKKVFNKIKSEIGGDINMEEYYKEISGIKHNVEKNLQFGLEPLLTKVQKYYNFNGFKFIWSAFYISYYDIQKKIGDDEIINKIIEYYKNKNIEDIKKLFFVSNSPVDKDKELYTIFNPIEIPEEFYDFKNEIEKKNKNFFYSMEEKIYQNENSNKNIKGKMLFFVVNRFFTRKQVEPILQNICSKIRNN